MTEIAPHMPNRTLSRSFLWLLALLLVAEAAGTSFYISQFEELFLGLGGDLPSLTKAVLMGTWLIWAIPTVAVAVILSASMSEKKKFRLLSALVLLRLFWLPIAIYGLYLPVWELSEVNGA